MSDTPTPPPTEAAKPATVPAATPSQVQDALNQLTELKVYTHSPILYWWPIWLLGFLFGFISLFVGGEGTEAAQRVQGAAVPGQRRRVHHWGKRRSASE